MAENLNRFSAFLNDNCIWKWYNIHKIENDIVDALEDEQLFIYIQPKINMLD